MNYSDKFICISGTGNHTLAKDILNHLNNFLADKFVFTHVNMDRFPDKELNNKVEFKGNISGKHLILMQSLSNLTLKEQLFDYIFQAKELGVDKVIVVLPFMMYRRQDHPQNGEINRNLRLVKEMQDAGVTHVILCDIHSQITIENFKSVGVDAINVDPASIYAKIIYTKVLRSQSEGRKYYIFSPDKGSINRSVSLARVLKSDYGLDVTVAISLKTRLYGDTVEVGGREQNLLDEVSKIYPDVSIVWADKSMQGADVCISDDELATGTTARDTGWFLKKDLGVKRITFVATHAVCTDGWKAKFIENTPFDFIYIGDTLHRGYEKATGGAIFNVTVSEAIAKVLSQKIVEI